MTNKHKYWYIICEHPNGPGRIFNKKYDSFEKAKNDAFIYASENPIGTYSILECKARYTTEIPKPGLIYTSELAP